MKKKSNRAREKSVHKPGDAAAHNAREDRICDLATQKEELINSVNYLRGRAKSAQTRLMEAAQILRAAGMPLVAHRFEFEHDQIETALAMPVPKMSEQDEHDTLPF